MSNQRSRVRQNEWKGPHVMNPGGFASQNPDSSDAERQGMYKSRVGSPKRIFRKSTAELSNGRVYLDPQWHHKFSFLRARNPR